MKQQGEKTIFIVDDNEVYGKSLQTFIQTRFPNLKEIKCFRIGEMCLMELDRNPSIVIMDYFLNSKYEHANNGLEIIKRIKATKPHTNIIVLSEQKDPNVFLTATSIYDCVYLQKGEQVFDKIEHAIKGILDDKTAADFEPLN